MGGSGGLAAGAGGGTSGVHDASDPNVTWLGPCTPLDLSADGQTALALEGVWNRASGWTKLPDLPGGDEHNQPIVLSADGRAVFGCSGSATSNCELYRWTEDDGIQGLGRSYAGPSLRFGDSLGTDFDGSTLVACAMNENFESVLLRWTQSDSFQVVDTGLFPGELPCASGSAALSSNGRTIATDFFIDGSLGGLVSVANRPPLPGESTTSTVLWYQRNNAHHLEVTAISGDGGVLAAYQYGDATVNSSLCLSAPNCNSNNVLEDLSYDGTSGVGRLLDFPAGSLAIVAPIYWSQAGDLEFMSDAFAARGVVVDPTPLSPFSISEDGHTLLGISTRHYLDGSAHDECFVASFGAPPTSEPLPALAKSCGNGVVDPGEECDDGNPNNSDACTTRCQRIALVAGPSSTCAIHHGHVECWGTNVNIRGAGEVSRGWSPVEIPATDGAIQLAIGGDHACIVREGGTVRCWGANNFGKLGDGSTNASDTAVDVIGLTGAVQVAAAPAHTCALLSDGSVRCWGVNGDGQLGDGTLTDSPVPVAVSNLTNAVQLSAGYGNDQTCALLSDATVSCWGYLDSVATSVSPVIGLSNVREIMSGFDFNYALLLDGRSVRWLGSSPIFGIDGVFSGVAQEAVGDRWQSLCYLGENGSIACDSYPGFGISSTDGRSHSGGVFGIHNAVQIAVSDEPHACALLATGEVRCWGNDSNGQLGNGMVKTNIPYGLPTPVTVEGFP